eukprot:2914085-Pleurochrysis_carterae.AAC.1
MSAVAPSRLRTVASARGAHAATGARVCAWACACAWARLLARALARACVRSCACVRAFSGDQKHRRAAPGGSVVLNKRGQRGKCGKISKQIGRANERREKRARTAEELGRFPQTHARAHKAAAFCPEQGQNGPCARAPKAQTHRECSHRHGMCVRLRPSLQLLTSLHPRPSRSLLGLLDGPLPFAAAHEALRPDTATLS